MGSVALTPASRSGPPGPRSGRSGRAVHHALGVARVLAGREGDAEVDDLHPRVAQHDIGWLDVAVHETAVVGVRECGADG